MAPKKHGRRAASTPVKTPLTELTEALSANSGAVGRRAAVVAAAGGLIVTVGLPAANQAGKDEGVVSASAEAADQSEIEFTNQAKIVVPEAAEAEDSEGDEAAGAAQAEPVTATAAPEPAPEPSSNSSDATSDRGSNSSRSSDRSSEEPSKAGGDVKVPDGSKAEQVISIAKQYVGVPYVYGGTSPSGWDCSGFTAFVYGKAGVNLPRTSSAQKAAGTVVSASEAKPGDLVYKPGHIGIYAGNGMMYDAGSSSSDTSYRSHSWMGNVTYIRVL